MIEHIKKSGMKNPLSIEEMNYFENELGNRYRIGEQIGFSGARTSVYLVHNENNELFVLKISNDPKDNDWIVSQKESYNQRDLVLNGYTGNVFIPKIICAGNDYILEEYAGVEFTDDVYEELSEENKKYIAFEIAKFLYYLHHIENSNAISPLVQCKNPSLREIFEHFVESFNDEDKIYITGRIKEFESRDLSDEIAVKTHGDLRAQNVLYSSLTKKIAIIDFEAMATRNIYHDFVPFAAASFGMSYAFWKKMINVYNCLEENNLSINPEKVRLLMEMGIFHEYGRCAMFRNDSATDFEKIFASKVKPMTKTVNDALTNNISENKKGEY